jgi:hypothetical protein
MMSDNHQSWFSRLRDWLRASVAELRKRFRRAKKQIGIGEEKEPLAFDIAAFVKKARLALDSFPEQYRQVCQITPLQDETRFVGREEELEELQGIYEQWEQGRFVSCAIVGEKGSGVTTLLNIFLNKHPDTSVWRGELHEKIYLEEQLIQFFGGLIEQPKLSEKEALIAALDQEAPCIIIIENLQHLFLKKVGGFEAMKALFDILAHTSKKVFWVGSFTPPPWRYLDLTLAISNYFTHEIRLKPMEREEIETVIGQRHEAEGYHIEIEPAEDQTAKQSYRKLDDAEKQRYLQKKFFDLLHRLSNGNVSLAQLYWIRAVQTVEEDVVSIKGLKQVDVSFLDELPFDKLLALQVMLLHDGLTLDDFALAMNEPLAVCRNLLIPMREKGLLIQPEQKYTINPVLYRAVLDFLSDKNFIH